MNVINLNCGEVYEDFDHHSYIHNLSSCEIEAMTSAIPVQCYQANWELVTVLIHNIPVDGEDFISFSAVQIFICSGYASLRLVSRVQTSLNF